MNVQSMPIKTDMELEFTYKCKRINAPELKSHAEFVAWLNKKSCATWHVGPAITEMSDTFIWFDRGEGSDEDMPEDVWKSLGECVGHDFSGIIWLTFCD